MELELSINGVIESLDIAPGESLLTLLRREGYCEVKQGCGTGECGACTVLVDGVARPGCVMLAAQAGGCTLMTVDGLAPAQQLHPLQQAFIECGAVQCGFCTPGMLLSAAAFLQHNADPTEAEVRDALSGNLCHCTGYEKPVQAVLQAAAGMRGEAKTPLDYSSGDTGKQPVIRVRSERGSTAKIPTVSAPTPTMPINGQLRVVGQSLPLIDAEKLVSGKAAFADDITLRGMLYGRVLTSPHAHAVIRDIDVTQAKALPGVYSILTYKDVARVAYASSERPAEGPRDQYSLDYRVRYVGDRVAVVAAETPEIAEQALRLIQVDYNVLPAISDPRQALEVDTPALHPEIESRGIYDAKRNVAARLHSEIGNLDAGFAAADLIVENEYVVFQQQPLVQQSVATYFDEDGYLVVRTGTRIPNYLRSTLASLLNLPARRIRVVKTNVGGDAGAGQELVLEDLCALLTLSTNRPVLMSGSHADEPLRVAQQSVLRVKTGVKRDGTFVANQMILLTGTGASATHPLITRGSASFGALALYPCQHMRFAAEVLYTTMPPARAGYAVSAQQEFFALESQVDEIARQLGMDALELRRKNLPGNQDANALQVAPTSIAGLTSCLQIVEEKLRWREMRGRVSNGHIRRGVGIALSQHGDSVGENDKSTSGAIIKLNTDGSFDVFAPVCSSVSRTLVAQVAAEVLGVTVDEILLHTSDTSLLPFETGASIYNSAVPRAAEQVRRQMLSVAGRLLGALPETLRIDSGIISAPQGQSVTVAQVAEQALYVEGRQIMTTASVKDQHEPLAYAAHGVEVEVDTETGEVHVLKAISAVDAGRVLNPLLIEGQVQGDTMLGLSAALNDERLYDAQGVPLSNADDRVLNACDMPSLQTYLVESDAPSSLFGAKPVAPTFGSAPALANAVADALGARIRQLPLTPERVLRAVYAQTAKK